MVNNQNKGADQDHGTITSKDKERFMKVLDGISDEELVDRYNKAKSTMCGHDWGFDELKSRSQPIPQSVFDRVKALRGKVKPEDIEFVEVGSE